MLFLINPIDHPVLPRVLSRDSDTASPPSSEKYHRIAGSPPAPQYLNLNSLFSVEFPTRASFLPILSFSTNRDYYDIPLPSLPDYVVSFREVFQDEEEYCSSLLEPLQKLDQNMELANFYNREDRLFFRGNATHFVKELFSLDVSSRSVMVARPIGTAEVVDSEITGVTDRSYGSYYIDEKSSLNYQKMFNSLLKCRYAL